MGGAVFPNGNAPIGCQTLRIRVRSGNYLVLTNNGYRHNFAYIPTLHYQFTSFTLLEIKMEQELLQIIGVFAGGVVVGIIIMLILNKMSSGSASPSAVKQEFEEYQNEVERHFEETSQKFKDMTEQYQDLYKHLSVGATSLCRPDSVAAALADESSPMSRPAQLEEKLEEPQEQGEVSVEPLSEEKSAPLHENQKAAADPLPDAKLEVKKEPEIDSKSGSEKT